MPTFQHRSLFPDRFARRGVAYAFHSVCRIQAVHTRISRCSLLAFPTPSHVANRLSDSALTVDSACHHRQIDSLTALGRAWHTLDSCPQSVLALDRWTKMLTGRTYRYLAIRVSVFSELNSYSHLNAFVMPAKLVTDVPISLPFGVPVALRMR